MIVDQRFDDTTDQFPIGMRVLAVDDNPICLRLLDSLLRKCQYHVTTTNEAITALSLLRDNKNQFDLVISDVHMPDMDGFKLLELVGLEMDLPVIMLSANGDTKLVMKGITHGACDYLLKPVRIEELKNIWQHVIRRKKNDPKDQLVNNNNHDKNQLEVIDPNGFFDPNVKNRKRKDQEGDDDDENNNNEDGSNQKKPRVVWTVELHRKFVSAVNHMGIDKAVPKKILDLMNVDKLTRENVASHLQKYRLYLKRISCVASHQANMVAALGGVDSAFLRMGSFGGGFQNAHFRSPASGMLGRLNTPTALGLVQFGHELNVNNPNHVQIGDLVSPSSSTFSDKNSMIRLPIGQPLDIQKGILGISNSGTQSNDFHDFSGCYENFQGQTEQIGYSFNMVNELGDTMSSMAMSNGPSLNGSVMQGWDGNGIIIDTSSHSNDSGMIQGMTMTGPFNQRIDTTTTNGLAFYSNNNNEFGSVPNFFNDSLSGKQRFLMDKQRKTHNGVSYVNNNVWSLEDLISPVMNQEKGL